MNLSLFQPARRRRHLNTTTLLCAAFIASASHAQQVVPDPPPPLTRPPGAADAEPTAPVAGERAPEEIAADRQILRWRQIIFHPHFSYRLTYGDDIQSSPGRGEKTFIQYVAPGLEFQIGRRWRLDYTPEAVFYSDDAFKDTLNHSVSLTGSASYNDWDFGLSQTYSSVSEPLVETAAQTDQENFNTGLSAIYQITGAWSLELGLSQEFRFLESVNAAPGLATIADSRRWSTVDWLNYQVTDTTAVALGVGGSYEDVDIGTDMTSEQLLGRVQWRVTEKLYLSLNGGAEWRQFLDSTQSDRITPLFDVTLDYQLFEYTRISLKANRTVAASYFENQTSEIIGVIATLRQRLLGRLQLSLSGGYNNTQYIASDVGVTAGREDDYYFFNTSLGMPFLEGRALASVFFTQSENSSNNGQFEYSSSQVGFQLNYRY